MSVAPGRDPELEALLEYMRASRGFDFTGYKRASLARRIDKRLQAVHVESYAEYRAYLEATPEEFERLFDAGENVVKLEALFRSSLEGVSHSVTETQRRATR